MERPEYARLGSPDNGTIFKYEGGGSYYIDAGCWSFQVHEVDGKLVAKKHPMAPVEGREIFPATREEWVKCNGHVTGDKK